VIGMTERVTIKTAHALAEAFYRQFLAQGKIGEVDRALVEAYAGLSGRTDVNVMSGGITDWALVGVTVRKSPQTNAANGGRTLGNFSFEAGSRQRVAKILRGVTNDG